MTNRYNKLDGKEALMPGNFKMTTKEVCDDMRRRGCKIGEPALRKGI